MDIHYFQHTPTEGLGKIRAWAQDRGHALSGTHFDRRERLPNVDEIDWLVIMGGPMNVYQYRDHPWLRDEKRCIAQAIERGKTVLGVCLGAQLIADVLGAKVHQNPEFEIGWLPVRLLDAAHTVAAFEKFPRELTPLHWHGDTFDLPPGALALAKSDGCKNQAFAVGNNLIGVQFHIEVTLEDVRVFCEDDPTDGGQRTGPFIQTREEILTAAEQNIPPTHKALETMLDALAMRASV
jgi:GMP synthase-like glutamine amidotransferase